MARQENDILNRVRIALSERGFVSFRNNTGLFLTLDGTRKVMAGLGKDTHDLIGWRSIVVTPEMVGKRIAVFMSCEGKTESGEMSEGQARFLTNVRKAGGISFVARCAEDIPNRFEFPDA